MEGPAELADDSDALAANAMMGLFHLASAAASDPVGSDTPDHERDPSGRAGELHEDDARRQYTGVYWDAGRKKWKAQIAIETKLEALGRFDKKSDAARAYDDRARMLGRGVNFPRPGEPSTKLRSRPQHVRTGKTFRKQTAGKGGRKRSVQTLGGVPISLECNEDVAPGLPVVAPAVAPPAVHLAAPSWRRSGRARRAPSRGDLYLESP